MQNLFLNSLLQWSVISEVVSCCVDSIEAIQELYILFAERHFGVVVAMSQIVCQAAAAQ